MAIYKLTNNPIIIRTNPDGTTSSIPLNPASTDYQQYLAWVALGNTPDPADPTPPVYTLDIEIRGRVRTTDATATELYRTTLHTLTAYDVALRLLAVDAGNGAVRKISADATFKRLNAGALQVGTTTVLASHADAGATAWTIVMAPSGNDVVVTVTGAAGRTIDWGLRGFANSYTPAGA